jgi:hypothetical protein
VFRHGAAEAVAEAIDVSALREQRLAMMGDDGEEEAATGDVGAAIIAHWNLLGRDRWNRCACSTLRPRVARRAL